MSHQRTVYVVDRDLASRRLLTAHLARIGAEAWPFAGGAEFLDILDHLMPACVLLDMDVAAPCGLEVVAELGHRRPGWPVVAMSAAPEVTVAVEAMKLGALDFLEKPVEAAGLAAALLPAWTSLERSLEASETRRLAGERLGRLTPRELDIALALFAGHSNKAVAHLLGISVRTVEMHRAHIMAKLGVKTLAEAAVLATQARLAAEPARAPPAVQSFGPSTVLLPRRRLAAR
jgi:two-component system, LuxR family, response regulator FixJ